MNRLTYRPAAPSTAAFTVQPAVAVHVLHQVLFVCTGNSYRSRGAELFFATRAVQTGLPWGATSRGFVLAPQNVGPIAPVARAELVTRGCPVPRDVRCPVVLHAADRAAADLVVALNEAEHRPWFDRCFPAWADRVESWHIPDVAGMAASTACVRIAHDGEQLLARLAATPV